MSSPPSEVAGLLRLAAQQGLVRPASAASRRTGSPAPDKPAQQAPVSAAERAVEGTGAGPDSRVLATQAAASTGCREGLEGTQGAPIGLAVTYELDAPPVGALDGRGLFSVALRFVGRRNGTEGGNDPRDRFEQVESVDGLPADAGRITVTTKVVGINAGEWHVTAEPSSAPEPAGTARTGRPRRTSGMLSAQETTARTRLAPLLHGPGVRQAAWPILVLLGVLLALVLQGVLLQRSGGPWRYALFASPTSVLVGYVVAKSWYLVMHRQHPRRFVAAGTYIQGFVVGTFATTSVLLAATGRPIGPFLDATAPGLFLAMAVGRPGCFLGGCCVGRPTASHWGIWSSDRRVGVRRVPVQLLEAAMALVLGLVALVLFLTVTLPVPGALFAGGVAAYTVGRQLLFPLRREPRRTSAGRLLVLVASGAVVCAMVLVSVVASSS